MLDYQHSVNGFVIGRPTVYILSDVTGMGLGPKDAKKYPIAGAAGWRWGREHRRGNLVTFEGHVETPGDPAAAWAAIVALRAAWAATGTLTTPDATVNWTFRMPGAGEITTAGRPDAFDFDTAQLALGLIPFVGTFECRTSLGG